MKITTKFLIFFSTLCFSIITMGGDDLSAYVASSENREGYRDKHHLLLTNELSEKKQITGQKSATKKPVNFAKHYVISTVECGGGTVCGEIADANTGNVVGSFPNAYYINGEDGTAPFAFISKPDSRLLIIIGVSADPEIGMSGEKIGQYNRQRHYEFIDNKLHLIRILEK